MRKIIWDYQNTVEESIEDKIVTGILVGGDIESGKFHFIVSEKEQYGGKVRDITVIESKILGSRYRARIAAAKSYSFASDITEEHYTLIELFTV